MSAAPARNPLAKAKRQAAREAAHTAQAVKAAANTSVFAAKPKSPTGIVLSVKYASGAAKRAGKVQRFGASSSSATPVSRTASIAAYRGAAGEEDSEAHSR